MILREKCTSSDPTDWQHRIINKEFHQITKTTSFEDFQKRQQLKWIAHITQRENNDIIKMLTFHTTSNKILGRKLPTTLERAIT